MLQWLFGKSKLKGTDYKYPTQVARVIARESITQISTTDIYGKSLYTQKFYKSSGYLDPFWLIGKFPHTFTLDTSAKLGTATDAKVKINRALGTIRVNVNSEKRLSIHEQLELVDKIYAECKSKENNQRDDHLLMALLCVEDAEAERDNVFNEIFTQLTKDTSNFCFLYPSPSNEIEQIELRLSEEKKTSSETGKAKTSKSQIFTKVAIDSEDSNDILNKILTSDGFKKNKAKEYYAKVTLKSGKTSKRFQKLQKYIFGTVKYKECEYVVSNGRVYRLTDSFFEQLKKHFEVVISGRVINYENLGMKPWPVKDNKLIKEDVYNIYTCVSGYDKSKYLGDKIFYRHHELFDVMIKRKRTYMIQCKRGFDNRTRDSASQIVQASWIIRYDRSCLNEYYNKIAPDNTQKKTVRQQILKKQSQNITKEEFINLRENNQLTFAIGIGVEPNETNMNIKADNNTQFAKAFLNNCKSTVAKIEILRAYSQITALNYQFGLVVIPFIDFSKLSDDDKQLIEQIEKETQSKDNKHKG